MAGRPYEIRVKGRVSDVLLASFDRLDADVQPVETVLYGTLSDQAELHALLERIASLGLELMEVRRLPGPTRHDET